MVKLTKAAWEHLDRLVAFGHLGYREEPPPTAWELERAGLAYFLSGASWTLVSTDAGRAALSAHNSKDADHG